MLLGIETEVRFQHPWNIYPGIDWTLPAIVTVVRASQLLNVGDPNPPQLGDT
jgi:hypothetical protein